MRGKKTGKYRSKFEEAVGKILPKTFRYEPDDCKLPYTIPASEHVYTPDFVGDGGIYLECKGFWDKESRTKMKLLKEQHPDLRIIMVFQNPNVKCDKRYKTTYADFCRKNDIEWCSLDSLKQLLRKT